jgi:peptide/nickel transport system permease protein
VWEQYGKFLWNALHGDLGYDYYHQVAVTSIIGDAIPKTLSIAIGAAILWLALGVFNGVLSAVRPRSFVDRGLTVFALVFYSMPTFLLGLLLLYFLYYRLTVAGAAWFPPGGYIPLSEDPGGWLRSMILPWLTVALVSAATYTRLTRASMLDVLGEDYIRTARSKGLSERRVVYRHGLRSALTPVVTQFGIDLGALVGGIVVTETVFSIDGLGREAIIAINQQDLPVIIGSRRARERPGRHRVRSARPAGPSALTARAPDTLSTRALLLRRLTSTGRVGGPRRSGRAACVAGGGGCPTS